MFNFEVIFMKAASIAGMLLFCAVIIIFLRLLYGPKGFFRASIPTGKEKKGSKSNPPEDTEL